MNFENNVDFLRLSSQHLRTMSVDVHARDDFIRLCSLRIGARCLYDAATVSGVACLSMMNLNHGPKVYENLRSLRVNCGTCFASFFFSPRDGLCPRSHVFGLPLMRILRRLRSSAHAR